MAKFKITFTGGYGTENEEIQASSFYERGDWTDFVDGMDNILLRLRSNSIVRIDRIQS